MGTSLPTYTPSAADDEEAIFIYALQLASASVLPMTLKAAIQLGLLELLYPAGPGSYLSSHELAERLGAANPDATAMIERILRLLVSYSILTRTTTTDNSGGATVHLYGAAAVCKYLIPNEDGVSMAALSLYLQDKVSMESWYYMKEAVLSGGVPFNMAYGGLTSFEYHEKDPRYSKVFHEGMMSHSIIVMKNILEKYTGFDGIRILVDVGGGTGSTLSMITAVHPQIKGINFDLPHVIAQAPSFTGLENVSGDMFSSVPRGDAILMKWILHDWKDEDCLRILKNCWNALPEKGKVVVVDFVLPETIETSLEAQVVYHSDMLMLLESPSGKERSIKEFQDLATKSGFTGFEAILCVFGAWIMEFTK